MCFNQVKPRSVMNHFFNKVGILLLIGLLVQGCRQRSEPPVLPDNSLAITGVSIPEAPNVTIDIN